MPILRQDAQWCAAFIRYLRDAYESDLVGEDPEPHRVKLAKKLQRTALVFFDFWADLSGESAGAISQTCFSRIT